MFLRSPRRFDSDWKFKFFSRTNWNYSAAVHHLTAVEPVLQAALSMFSSLLHLSEMRLCAKLQSTRVSMRAPFGDCFVYSRHSPWLTECSCEIRNQAYDVPSRSSLVSTASHFNRSESDDFRPVIFLQNFKNKRARHMTTRRLRKHFRTIFYLRFASIFKISRQHVPRTKVGTTRESNVKFAISSLAFEVIHCDQMFSGSRHEFSHRFSTRTAPRCQVSSPAEAITICQYFKFR